jgi:hypothetical protein
MATVEVTVLLPVQDNTHSIETGEITKTSVTTPADGAKILNALDNKNNTLQIYVENSTQESSTDVASEVYIKAGNNYPNAKLGDLTLTLGAGKTTAILLEDISRFENRDKSVKLTFKTGFTGKVWAVAKRAGVMPKTQQDALDA